MPILNNVHLRVSGPDIVWRAPGFVRGGREGMEPFVMKNFEILLGDGLTGMLVVPYPLSKKKFELLKNIIEVYEEGIAAGSKKEDKKISKFCGRRGRNRGNRNIILLFLPSRLCCLLGNLFTSFSG